MKTIKQKYQIKSSVDKVWQALIDPKVINAWGGGPAKMKDEEGFKFEFWGGSIWGKNIKVIKNKKLVEEWFSENEIVDTPSVVTFTLKDDNGYVEVNLTHEKVPDDAEKDISDGWKNYYLGQIKKYLEK